MKQKNQYIQLWRGIIVLFVVLIHTMYMTELEYCNIFNIVTRRIINFAVPMFIFLAGYYTNIKNTKEFYKKKIKRIVPTLIVWNVIYTIIYCLHGGVTYKELIKTFINGSSAGHLYYLYVLLQLFLIAPILIRFYNKTEKGFLSYLPVTISIVSNFIVEIIFREYRSGYKYMILGWISYYYFGIIIKNLDLKTIKKQGNIICLCALILNIIEGVLVYKILHNYEMATTQLSVFNAFYSLSICLFMYLHQKINISKNNLFVRIGNYSFGIYLSHILVLKIVEKIIRYLSISNYFIRIIIIYIPTIIILLICNYIYYDIIKKYLKKEK